MGGCSGTSRRRKVWRRGAAHFRFCFALSTPFPGRARVHTPRDNRETSDTLSLGVKVAAESQRLTGKATKRIDKGCESR